MGCSGSSEAHGSKRKKTKDSKGSRGKKEGRKGSSKTKSGKRKSTTSGDPPGRWRSRPDGGRAEENVKLDFTNLGAPEVTPASKRKSQRRPSTLAASVSRRSVGETLPPPSEIGEQSSSRDATRSSLRYGTGSEYGTVTVTGTATVTATGTNDETSQYMSSHYGAGETLPPDHVVNPLQSPPLGGSSKRPVVPQQQQASSTPSNTGSNFPNPLPDLDSIPSRSGSNVSTIQEATQQQAKRVKELQDQLITLQKQEVTARVSLQATLLGSLKEMKAPPPPVSDNSTMPAKIDGGVVSNRNLKGEEYAESETSQFLGTVSSNDDSHVPTSNHIMNDEQRQRELERLVGGDLDDSFEDDGPRRCSMQTKESKEAGNVGLAFKPKESEEDLRIKKMSSSTNATNPYSRANVRRHSHEHDLWVIIRNTVYNLTEFHDLHPGGTWPLLQVGGKDATKTFEDQHGAGYLNRLNQYIVGKVPAEEKW